VDISASRLSSLTAEEQANVSVLLLPWIDGIVEGAAAAEAVATYFGCKKVVGVVLRRTGYIDIGKFGYRSKLWKPRGYISDYNFFTQRYRPLVAAERPELNVSMLDLLLHYSKLMRLCFMKLDGGYQYDSRYALARSQ
jgi:hypothetical protein